MGFFGHDAAGGMGAKGGAEGGGVLHRALRAPRTPNRPGRVDAPGEIATWGQLQGAAGYPRKHIRRPSGMDPQESLPACSESAICHIRISAGFKGPYGRGLLRRRRWVQVGGGHRHFGGA